MTAGQLLSSKSTISNTSAAEHLKHIQCVGGSVSPRYINALKIKYDKTGYVAVCCRKKYNVSMVRKEYRVVYDRTKNVAISGKKNIVRRHR